MKMVLDVGLPKAKLLFSKQRQVIKINSNGRHAQIKTDQIMKHLDILNIFKLSFLQILKIKFPLNTRNTSK